jgi:hypothetical protein
MTYVTAEARQQLLDTVAEAIEEIGTALAVLGDAYEHVDDHSADKLEEELFRPVQAAYGVARRTHSGFADRHALPTRTFQPAPPGSSPAGVKDLIEGAVDAVAEADLILSELQDSMMPVDVGDAELRAGLSEVRRTIGDVDARARRFLSLLGR